jgi:glutamate/tyrosine decarboxylase-like PLP-dependent enzyme
MTPDEALNPDGESLDPQDWTAFRSLAHEALDKAIDSLEGIRCRPVWKPVPERVRARLSQPLPLEGQGLEKTLDEFHELIFPYSTGNTHPRFFGWVHGTGTASGIVAEMMAAAMNSNCGGRDHGALYVERAVIEWSKQMLGYPESASGVLVSGTSMATLVALTVARHHAIARVRQDGICGAAGSLVAYTSSEAHESITKAFEVLGLGSAALRHVPVNPDCSMDLEALRAAIQADRLAGLSPFCIIATAGTVNSGAIDDLQAIAGLCAEESAWFHVDGAFGALAVLDERLKHLVSGIEQADSIAFDYHKWLHVPYDAGCVLIRRGDLHRAALSTRPSYLAGADRGLAGGGTWFCEYGIELSRSFRALKIWFALKEFGAKRFGECIRRNCEQACYLSGLVRLHPQLELLIEPVLNIVCFRYVDRSLDAPDLDGLNSDIVADLHESGMAAPSTTRVNGKLAIRVAITNHRATREDFRILVRGVLAMGNARVGSAAMA